jgi:predicted MFS family arabinose efflux permease
VGLGLTWLATVPPTDTIVGKLFGNRYLSMRTLLSHQIGGFLGAFLGGFALARFGDYQWMWYADMALAAAAALIICPFERRGLGK